MKKETIKRNVFLSIVMLFLILNITAFGQVRAKDKQTKAEYVLELIRKTTVDRVYIVAVNYHIEYNKEWLSNISVRDNLIIFKSDYDIHTWDIQDAIFIEKNKNVVKVRLKVSMGK